jgi:PPOX class probable F420-dependent enzyme
MIDTQVEERIRSAYIIWLTTVRADGTPQPTPVWFIWENGTFLIYSKPDAQKIRNIYHNPRVALNLDSEAQGETYLVITGEASIDESYPRADQVPAYQEKYHHGIRDIGYTPESHAQTWSLAIRVHPIHSRGQ